MALRTIPPVGEQQGYSSSANRRPNNGKSFAALYEATKKAAGNDNAGQNNPGKQENQGNSEAKRAQIEDLHSRVNNLRGEITSRVGRVQHVAPDDAWRLTNDISRLSNRLEQLRSKLKTEEERLSGKIVDVEI